jgi:membrane-associated phospholipid phosphatase
MITGLPVAGTGGRPMRAWLGRRPSPTLLVVWFGLVAAAQVVAGVILFRFFVDTARGQRIETIALAANSLGAEHVAGPVNTVLNAISIAAVVAAMVVVGFIALIRRRYALAVVSVVLIAGANLTAELLKRYLVRPDLGIDEARAAAGNSFPSGHTAIAASVAVAFVLVLPPRARGTGAVVGAFYAALLGVATLSAGWHRPSDAVGAYLVVGVWAALSGILLRTTRRRGEWVADNESHRPAVAVLAVAGVVLLALGGVGLHLTDQVASVATDRLSQHRLAMAYGGSAAGIAGVASVMMASVLLTVHRIVPRRRTA